MSIADKAIIGVLIIIGLFTLTVMLYLTINFLFW